MARDLNTNINILQKAIILGHQQIFRYLTSNFQELINLRDAQGRTALHYAASLQDNNYIYKTLINRGADTSAKDHSGKTPGHYNKNKKLLNKAMLINYMEGASVSDKITNNNKSSEKKDSSNTVAPLKSRLLTAILRKSRAEKTELFTENLDSDQVQKIDNIYEMMNGRNDKTRINPERSLLKIPVDREIFDRVKVRVSSMSGGTLLDVLDLCQHLTDHDLHHRHHLPLLAPDPAAYDIFSELFHPWIESKHNYKITDSCPSDCWGDSMAFSEHIHPGPHIKLIEIQVSRSLHGLPFAPRMTVDHFETVEKQVKEALKHVDPSLSGLYLTLDSSNWSPEMVDHLNQEHVLFDHQAPLYDQPNTSQHWPVGRAVYYSKNKDFVAWINHSEHLILRSLEKRGNIKAAVSRLQSVVSMLEKRLHFAKHQKLGYVNLKPTHLGTGLKAKISVDLPQLANNMPILRSLCSNYDILISSQNMFTFTLETNSSMGLTEFQMIAQFFTGIKEILIYEQ